MFRTLILIVAISLIPITAPAQSAHLCTGLGLDAREEASAFPHTLKLVFAAVNGDYVGDVAVTVSRGDAQVFKGICDGPWLLMNLDPGRYSVVAEFEGQRKSVTVNVGHRASEKTIAFRNAK